jgi:nucleoside-diphosphate-sugar epimerase
MITVLGASGFIGSRLAGELKRLGLPYRTPDRHERLDGRALGDAVYCAGLTEDFRRRPLDTVAAHVGHLESVLRTAEVDSLVYLSSTRIYRSPGRATEDDVLELNPSDPDHLYDLSKATGEALALSAGIPVLVLRLANVYGLDLGSRNFLPSILQDAVRDGAVTLRTTLESTRNYVSVDDVVAAIMALLERDAQGIYNVAGERAASHREVSDVLAELTRCEIQVADGAPTETAPDISIARLSAAIDYAPESVLDALPRLVDGYRRALSGVRSG